MTVLLSVISIVLAIIILILVLGLYKREDKGADNVLADRLITYERNLKDEFAQNRRETAASMGQTRKETTESLVAFQTAVNNKLDSLTKSSQDSFIKQQESVTTGLAKVMNTVQETLALQQQSVQTSLKHIQESNEKKLEEMRITVDEKLHDTLEKRLTSSFELVTKQLEAVQKGLGEMQTLASDVGGLKRALTNVKTAGGMGEVQLEALLAQFLSPEQFEKNAHPNPANTRLVVEFAVKIPDKGNASGFIYLPVDSKYPAAVWDKLTKAYADADKIEIEAQRKALRTDIRNMAKDIKEKYIEAPYTTDFALMFVPFEGLSAEIQSIPGLFQEIQDEFKVIVTGPTNLTAFLNSLQMGFRTLAIQKQTSAIWDLLESVKSEFGKFGDVLAATKKKLESGIIEIEKAETRSRVIERQLKKMDKLPEPNPAQEPFLLTEE
ncbi:MAG: DNA recombination protein RmuC [Spirochaetia bacterium]|nr:DNA recombination protein RmuC [Spirochaetia bacterium]